MDYICVFLSSYVIVFCIFYFTEQTINTLLLDFASLSEGEIYIINIIIFTAINKFAIRHEYRMTKQQNKSDKYDILRKY